MTGNVETGKVKEITLDSIIYKTSTELNQLAKDEVLLIEYANGKTEIYTLPYREVIHKPDGIPAEIKHVDASSILNRSLLSINTLALCNADISIFYEYMLRENKYGVGLMGAYNFNLYVNSPNAYLAVVNNAKKLYDLGVYINFYPQQFKNRINLYYGFMLKYCAFRFTSEFVDPVSNQITAKPSEGYQLAPMLHFGTHNYISKNVFIKTLLGLGGIGLTGDFKQQFNYKLNSFGANNNNNWSFLPKLYIGINAGFSF